MPLKNYHRIVAETPQHIKDKVTAYLDSKDRMYQKSQNVARRLLYTGKFRKVLDGHRRLLDYDDPRYL